MWRRLHDNSSKHKLSLTEFRGLNAFLTSTQADFRRADAAGAGTLGTADVGRSLSQAGPALPDPQASQSVSSTITGPDLPGRGALGTADVSRSLLTSRPAPCGV